MPFDTQILNEPEFKAAFRHGMAIVLGVFLGLCIWMIPQKTPLIPGYGVNVTMEGVLPPPPKKEAPDIKLIIPAPGKTPLAETQDTKPPAPAPAAPADPHADPAPADPAAKPDEHKTETPPAISADPHAAPPAATQAPVQKTDDHGHEQAHETAPAQPAPAAAAAAPATPKVPERTAAPIDGLSEKKPPYGDLPIVRAKDQVTPFAAYRRAFPADKLDRPLIILIAQDFGLSEKASAAVLEKLPADVTVTLPPDTDPAWSQKAYKNGNELWLRLAAEPTNYPQSDMGSRTILTASTPDKKMAQVFGQLGSMTGYAGVYGTDTSPLFTNPSEADFISSNIYGRGLGFVINADKVAPIFKSSAREKSSAFYNGTVIPLGTGDDISADITRLETTAREKGFAIATFTPSPATITALSEWAKNIDTKGMAIAPLSVIAERGKELSP